ncbi:MAG: transglycosylase domain-containing protein [Pseudomonadota bacterium]
MPAVLSRPARIGRAWARFWPRVARMALLGLALLVLVPTVLGVAYRWVDPVSMPMLARWVTGQPVTREWRELDDMAPDVPKAVVMSEDGAFCQHRGVDWGALRALMRAPEGPTRGGSTIAMQTARNLFLWRDPSYVRKALEIPIALMLDRVLGKRRLMEVYLNIAEWDDGGVFGIAAGARSQLGQGAGALTRGQAARMVAVLPNPIVYRAASGRRTAQVAGIIERRVRGSGPFTACLAD